MDSFTYSHLHLLYPSRYVFLRPRHGYEGSVADRNCLPEHSSIIDLCSSEKRQTSLARLRGRVRCRVHGDYVSRSHAYIEIDGSDFLLVDASTNGSFVQTEDEQVEFVHRGHIRL